MMIAIDAETLAETAEAVGESMATCTANSGTTDNRFIGRRKLPFSLFSTSLQLCPTVHLRVQCKADRTFFTEEDNLYIDYQERHQFCVRSIVNKYFNWNQTVRTCDKLKLRNMMSNIDRMTASFSLPPLHLIGSDENCSQYSSRPKVITSCVLPVLMFSNNWMLRSHVPLLHNTLDRMLPALCWFGAFCRYPYAQFLMACFQHTCQRSVVCTRHVSFPSSSLHNSCSYGSSSMISEHMTFDSYKSSVGLYQCDEAEINCVHSGPPVEFNGATLSDDYLCDLAINSDMMQQPRNISKKNADKSSSGSSATVLYDSILANFADDVNDDYVFGSSLKKVSFDSNCMSVASCQISSKIDESGSTNTSNFRSSFFICASSIGTVDDSDDNDDDYDDGDSISASDDEFDCWDDDDSGSTSPVSSAQCFLVDLDPFKVSGLYIPQTSNVPVSQSRCLSLPVDLATEIESESERALKRINATWWQWYSDDVNVKSFSDCQLQAKHVCIFMWFVMKIGSC